jgi:hypothetical protein
MFENRRKRRNIWRKYAMFLGFNMRNSGINSPDGHHSVRKLQETKEVAALKPAVPSVLLPKVKGNSDLFPVRSCLLAEPVRLFKRDDSDFRRRLSFTDKLLVIAVILTIIAFVKCLLGDCVAFELVTRTLLRPLTGGQL